MSFSGAFWSWLVFSLSASAYLPIAVGAWRHPIELNLASYNIWLILSGIMAYSAKKQAMPGWKMMLGWVVGNAGMSAFGILRGEYSYVLGAAETVAVYGIIATLTAWAAVGTIFGKWNPRILFLGSLAADVFSFYPQLKQYCLPHEKPTYWMLAGWIMWIVASAANVLFVDRLISKLVAKPTRTWITFEASAISIENAMLMAVSIAVMYR